MLQERPRKKQINIGKSDNKEIEIIFENSKTEVNSSSSTSIARNLKRTSKNKALSRRTSLPITRRTKHREAAIQAAIKMRHLISHSLNKKTYLKRKKNKLNRHYKSKSETYIRSNKTKVQKHRVTSVIYLNTHLNMEESLPTSKSCSELHPNSTNLSSRSSSVIFIECKPKTIDLTESVSDLEDNNTEQSMTRPDFRKYEYLGNVNKSNCTSMQNNVSARSPITYEAWPDAVKISCATSTVTLLPDGISSINDDNSELEIFDVGSLIEYFDMCNTNTVDSEPKETENMALSSNSILDEMIRTLEEAEKTESLERMDVE